MGRIFRGSENPAEEIRKQDQLQDTQPGSK